MWQVYIIRCRDGSLYTGITNNLEKRFKDHKSGIGGAYTRSHKPVKIVYREKHKSRSLALKREAQIKSFTKLKKEQLIKSGKIS